MDYEKRKIKEYLGEDLYDTLKEYECIIAGDFIRNLFTKSEVNDVDIYFRSKEQLKRLLLNEFSGRFIVSVTKKAIMFKIDERLLQLIYIDYYDTPWQVFDTFDFTVCMGAFDFKTEEFALHKDFLKHNSQRQLMFNTKTLFPIISALRVNKYIDKGYTISKQEFIKVMFTVNLLKVNSLEELEEQLGGMHGESVDNIFSEDLKNNFDMNKALLELSEKEFVYKDRTPADYDNFELFIEELLEDKIKYCVYENQKYVRIGNELKFISEIKDNYVLCDIKEILNFPMIKYKCVEKIDDRYFSYYDKNYEYKLKEVMTPKNSCGLYVVDKEKIGKSCYYNNQNRAILKCLIESIDDLCDVTNTERVNKLIVLEEVNEN